MGGRQPFRIKLIGATCCNSLLVSTVIAVITRRLFTIELVMTPQALNSELLSHQTKTGADEYESFRGIVCAY
jgi:hypothetical protein